MGLVDVWDLERDHDPAGGAVDSNPVDVLADRGHLVIADAGANTLLKALGRRDPRRERGRHERAARARARNAHPPRRHHGGNDCALYVTNKADEAGTGEVLRIELGDGRPDCEPHSSRK